MNLTTIILTKEPGYALIRLNRPDVLNAINMKLMEELVSTLEELDKESGILCIIITGSEKAFAAGADIKEMADASAMEMLQRDQFARWDRIRKIKKPIIAAVSGFALGGGCELAMTWTSLLHPNGRNSASRKSTSALFPEREARSASPARSANTKRWKWCSPVR